MGPQGEMMGQKVAPLIWVAGAVAAAAAAVFFTTRGSPPALPDAPQSAEAVRPQAVAAPDAATAAPKAPNSEPAPGAALLSADPAPAASGEAPPAEAAALAVPEVDTFSHGRDGSAVLAGRAPGSARVELTLGDEVLAVATPDGQGRFALLFDLAPAAQARSLILRAEAPGGLRSAGAEVLVAPAPQEVLAAGQGDAAVASVEMTAADLPALSPDPASAEQTEAVAAPLAPVTAAAGSAEPGINAPTSLVVSDSGVAVLRAPLKEGLSIDAIAYGASGSVEVSGRSQPDTDVRIYLDNEKHRDVKTDARGAWSADLPEVPPGLYTLRADQTAADGRVMARAETPFLRENPDSLHTVAQPERSGVITVQPGFTLWGIARESFGDGLHYVKVFEANRDQIRNPDLIYPGQVFAIPQD